MLSWYRKQKQSSSSRHGLAPETQEDHSGGRQQVASFTMLTAELLEKEHIVSTTRDSAMLDSTLLLRLSASNDAASPASRWRQFEGLSAVAHVHKGNRRRQKDEMR